MSLFKQTPLKQIRIALENMYEVNDVETGYNYWFNKLLLRCMSIFNWGNLPETLPEREIELNILLTGHCVIFKHQGEIVTQCTQLFNNQDSIYYYPNKAIYSNPKIKSDTLKIGVNSEIIYNTPLQDNIFYLPSDGGMLTFISRYARMLADIESTLNIYTVNERLVSFPTASNDNTKNSLVRFFEKLAIGRREIISDNSIVEQFRNVDVVRTNIKDGVNDWIIARDKILEQFYRDIGVKMYNPKKAQVTEDEIESNSQVLLISLKDLLKERQQGVERVNKMFGTNITVEISDEFKQSEKGGVVDAVKED